MHSITRPQNVIATQQALYAALQRTRDIIIITDDALRIQYTNKTTERILGLKVVSRRSPRSIEAFAKKIIFSPAAPARRTKLLVAHFKISSILMFLFF